MLLCENNLTTTTNIRNILQLCKKRQKLQNLTKFMESKNVHNNIKHKRTLNKRTVKWMLANQQRRSRNNVRNRWKINIFKELKNFNTFYEYYSTLRKEFKKTKIALHFRIANIRKHRSYNIHPFYVNENLAFMHNGIINILLQKNPKLATQ